MITGDHAATARAIGEDLDIYRPGDLVVTGSELEDMDDAALDAAISRASVFARVSPSHKRAHRARPQAQRQIVAMTGDGVNDAPALKAADIGVAMGITGTDVAKDAADMVLLDDRFTTIVNAVREGRRVFRNIQKVVQFLVADNVAQIVVLLVAVALNWDAPLTAVMILWVNLATATLPALALGVEPASRHVMEHPPVRAGTLLEPHLARRVVFQGLFVAAFALVAYVWGRDAGSEAVGRTMAFAVVAFSQILRAVNQRSTTDPVWNREGGRNPWLVAAVAASAALMLLVLLVPPVLRRVRRRAHGRRPVGRRAGAGRALARADRDRQGHRPLAGTGGRLAQANSKRHQARPRRAPGPARHRASTAPGKRRRRTALARGGLLGLRAAGRLQHGGHGERPSVAHGRDLGHDGERDLGRLAALQVQPDGAEHARDGVVAVAFAHELAVTRKLRGVPPSEPM